MVTISKAWLASALLSWVVVLILVLFHAWYAFGNIASTRFLTFSCARHMNTELFNTVANRLCASFPDFLSNDRALSVELTDLLHIDSRHFNWDLGRDVHIDQPDRCLCFSNSPWYSVFGSTTNEVYVARSTVVLLCLFVGVLVCQYNSYIRQFARGLCANNWKGCFNFRLCSSMIFRTAAYDAVQSKIDKELLKRRQEQAIPFVDWACILCVLGYSIRVIQSSIIPRVDHGYFWESSVPDRADMKAANAVDELRLNLVGGETLPLAALCIVFQILREVLRRDLISKSIALDIATVSVNCIWIWRYCTLPRGWYEYNGLYLLVGRLLLGIVFGNARLTVGLHFMVTIVDLLCHRAHGLRTTPEKDSNEVFEQGYQVAQLMVIALVSLVTWNFERVMRAQATALVETKETKTTVLLLHRMLSAFCDCIVSVDADLYLSERSPRLEALLMRPSASSRFQFPAMSSFVHADDRPRFEAYLTSALPPDDTSGRPTTIHIHLTDSAGNSVPVQAFKAEILDDDDNVTILLGLKEDLEETFFDGFVGGELTASGVTTQSISSARAVGGMSSDGTASSSTSDTLSCASSEDDAPLFFDVMLSDSMGASSGLPVHDFSVQLGIMVGPSMVRGADMHALLHPEDVTVFRDYMREVVSALLYATNADGDEHRSPPIRLKPLSLGHYELCILATFATYPRFLTPDEENETDDNLIDLLSQTACRFYISDHRVLKERVQKWRKTKKKEVRIKPGLEPQLGLGSIGKIRL